MTNMVGEDLTPLTESVAGGALLEWVNALSISEKASTISDLNDGHTLWEIACDIDPNYFTGDLPEGRGSTGNWVAKWQNLKQLSKTLISYVTVAQGQSLPRGRDFADLKLIASSGNAAETIKLLKLILMAALHSQKNEQYVAAMISLNTASQAALKAIIEQIQNSVHTTPEAGDHDNDVAYSSSIYPEDQESPHEERLSKARAENDKLTIHGRRPQKELHDLHNRLARLKQNNDALQDKLTWTEDELEAWKAGAGAPRVKELESRVKEQEDFIANLEGQLFNAQVTNESLETSTDRLRRGIENERKISQELRDQVDEIKAQRNMLEKKANTIDKYRQKLQATQGLEKDNENLRSELEDMKQNFQDSEQRTQLVSSLQKRIQEYEHTLPKIDRDCHELSVMVRQLKLENESLTQRYQIADEQHTRDQESIADLIGKKQSLDSSRGSGAKSLKGLESELERSSGAHTLESANEELSKGLREAKRRSASLERKLNRSAEEHTKLEQKYLEALRQRASLEIPIAHIPEKQKSPGPERASGSRVENFTMDNENVEQVNEEKRISAGEFEALYQETIRLREVERVLQNHLEENTKRYCDSLVELSETTGLSDNLKDALENIRATATQSPSQHDVALDAYVSNFTQLIKDTRENAAKAKEARDLEIKALQDRLQQAETKLAKVAPESQDKTALRKEMESLRNENRLMASAFHDLSSRLQMNNVTLQRRSEAKGYLNRQRYAVNQATAVRSR